MKSKRLLKLVSTVVLVTLMAIALPVGCATPEEAPAPAPPEETYPSRPIHLICCWGVGGGSDTLMRNVAECLMPILGVPVTVTNIPGANGLTGKIEALAKPADGYTITQITVTGLEYMFGPEKKIDVPGELMPLCRLHYQESVIFAYPGTGWETAEDMLNYIKEHPGEVKIGCSSAAPSEGLIAELLARDGYEVVAVVNPEPGQRYAATMGGEVPLLMEQLGDVAGYVQAGKLKPLLILGPNRSPFPELAGVPCTAEFDQLKQDYSVMGMARGLAIKAGVPEDRVQILLDAIRTMIKTKKWKSYVQSLYMDPESSFQPAEEYLEFLKKVAIARGVLPPQ